MQGDKSRSGRFAAAGGDPVSQPTTAFLSYDDKNLYVGWICKDDPAQIPARFAKRKDIQSDDRVTINIDTFHDHRRAYWFDVNPYVIQFDGITTDGKATTEAGRASGTPKPGSRRTAMWFLRPYPSAVCVFRMRPNGLGA